MVETPQTPRPETQKKNTGMAIVAYILFFRSAIDRSKKRPFREISCKTRFGTFYLRSCSKFFKLDFALVLGRIVSLLSLGIFVLFIVGVI